MQMLTLMVKSFTVCDTDEGVYEADDNTSFEATDDLLQKLRNEHPNKVFSMVAELDA